MTSELTDVKTEKAEMNFLPHPNDYKKWFKMMDKIDLRRHLSEVELNLIEGALKKNNGSVTEASHESKNK